jgi:DNA-binding NtrC family response regulator
VDFVENILFEEGMENLSPVSVLIVDDEPQILLSCSVLLRSAGIKNVFTIDDSRQVIPLLNKQEISVIILDLSMPYISGKELLNEITQHFPQIPVIIMTAMNDLETAVECMKSGAFDYLVKPVEKDRFVSSVKKTLELCALRNEVSSLKHHLLTDHLENEAVFSSIITKSRKMRAIFQYIEVIAKTQQPVLISGETGVGKELIARSLHSLSGRTGSFIAVNVAGLDDTMFSDTLFGHKKGAYTGAEEERYGMVASASGGTLFLDEIGDMNESSQIKLLRLLQEQKYYPLGSDAIKKSDARIIVATNHDIQKLISTEKLRKDLFFRLRAHHVHIPPLRERIEDIPLLLTHFIAEAAKSLNKKKPTPPRELVTLLSTYHFPGNIREFQAMVFDAVARHKSGILSMDSFKEIIGQKHVSFQVELSAQMRNVNFMSDTPGRFPTLNEAEHYLISEALRLSDGNQGIAASLLGITRQALNKRLRRNTKK